MKLETLPLFPDLLEQCDLMRRNTNYEQRGHAVWSLSCDVHRAINEDESELICLSVVYDDERFGFPKDRTGKRWVVEINHHFYRYGMVSTGWGSSRKEQRKLLYSGRIHEKRFQTRDEAIAFAEKVQGVMKRLRAKIKGHEDE
jgi:hypothetical protein